MASPSWLLSRLVEEQEREKDVLIMKIQELGAKLDEKQALELQIVRIQGSINVLTPFADVGGVEILNEIESLEEQLRANEQQLERVSQEFAELEWEFET